MTFSQIGLTLSQANNHQSMYSMDTNTKTKTQIKMLKTKILAVNTYVVEEIDEESSRIFNDLEAVGLHTEAFGCHCHSFELVMKAALKPLAETISSLRLLATNLRNRSKFRKFIKTAIETVPFIPLDVPTRWSSTFRMIKAFLKSEGLFRACSAHHLTSEISSETESIELMKQCLQDADTLEGVCSLIEPIADSIKALEGDDYPTVHLIQVFVVNLRNNAVRAQASTNSHIQRAATIILDELSTRFSLPNPDDVQNGYVPSELIALYLDNNLRRLVPLNWRGKVKDELRRVIRFEMAKSDEPGRPNKVARSLHSELDDEWEEHRHNGGKELIIYDLMDPRPLDMDVLTWWRNQRTTLPYLSKVARTVFSYPASSASVERLFSVSGLVYNPRRYHLRPDRFEAQVLLMKNKKVHERFGIDVFRE